MSKYPTLTVSDKQQRVLRGFVMRSVQPVMILLPFEYVNEHKRQSCVILFEFTTYGSSSELLDRSIATFLLVDHRDRWAWYPFYTIPVSTQF